MHNITGINYNGAQAFPTAYIRFNKNALHKNVETHIAVRNLQVDASDLSTERSGA